MTTRSDVPSPIKRLDGRHPRQRTRQIIEWWINHRIIDWVAGAAIGLLLWFAAIPGLHLSDIAAGIRFSIYGALAAGIFAFVAVAFTPLAILAAFGPGQHMDRLRRFGSDIRRSFLCGTLVLLLCAVLLIAAGAMDSLSSTNTAAELLGSIAVGISTLKVLRLTEVFAAILGASIRDAPPLKNGGRSRQSA